jgi:predicted ester cyclase
MLSEGDRVVTQLLMEGTHRGAWMGIPARGKKLQIRMFTIHRVVQGKIVEDWVLVESLGFFQQLGVFRTQQTWWATSWVSKVIIDTSL